MINPPDAAIFTGILGIVMVLKTRETGGAMVISAALAASIFFEWWLYHRKPQSSDESELGPELRQMLFAAEQWEKTP